MTQTYIEKKSQEERVLEILSNNDWTDGMLFLRLDHPITQFHARIWGLQRKGYTILARFVEGKNWKEYKLVQVKQECLI